MRRPSIRFVARALARVFRDERGSSDLTVTLLLTAAGAAMVGLTVPAMFRSSDTAARTFDHQVQILERGAHGGPPIGGMSPGGAIPGLPGSIPGAIPGGPVPGFDLGLPGSKGGAPTPLTPGGGPLTPTP
ncbi:MAG: hypothetical protein JST00_20640 [Deltaproteobacteria bacterium]|nr:hypothetical protein [Deltaproteobacteria bacterium]